MSPKKRGEMIRHKILSEIRSHPNDISKYISEYFEVSVQSVNTHIRRLVSENKLIAHGARRNRSYVFGDIREADGLFYLSDVNDEFQLWHDEFLYIFDGLSANVIDICSHGFTEMVNNVFDHSEGTELYISISRNIDNIVIHIMDNGEGVFERIARIKKLGNIEQSLLELAKGKLTTDPENHSGEGIFFTSRIFDEFEIQSKGLLFNHNVNDDYDFLVDVEMLMENIGSHVMMMINRATTRTTTEVFDEFTANPEEPRFSKTIIPVALAIYKNEFLVSRSQAKRVLNRVDRFEEVILDFENVDTIGQAFADEVFRVYKNKNPHIQLLPINMNNMVKKMVARVN